MAWEACDSFGYGCRVAQSLSGFCFDAAFECLICFRKEAQLCFVSAAASQIVAKHQNYKAEHCRLSALSETKCSLIVSLVTHSSRWFCSFHVYSGYRD